MNIHSWPLAEKNKSVCMFLFTLLSFLLDARIDTSFLVPKTKPQVQTTATDQQSSKSCVYLPGFPYWLTIEASWHYNWHREHVFIPRKSEFLIFEAVVLAHSEPLGCPACGPQAAYSSGWLWMRPNTNLSKFTQNTMRFFVITCQCVFNVWPKTTLLPVWPRDTTRSDTPFGNQMVVKMVC